SRAAAEGGLNQETALAMSNSYILKVEELRSIDKVMNLFYRMVFDFTDRVRMNKEQNFSRVIMKCCDHISNNLNSDISLSTLAETAGVSYNYLSELFKKEVGISISEYIQVERIEKAKKLLVLSNDSITDIGISLNFSDQSHFTKIFKKTTGYTPKQYRNIYLE
ncbi:MAG: helix-turn-helix transcriptional regulator, partial [Clostridiales bacterium]|nr:helix-turn-helix transcriptional regulator [Clostridiales bacterium]